MSLWKISLFLILGIASRVSAGKWKEPNFTSTKISQFIRQGFTLSCQDCSTLQYLLPGAEETTKILCSDGKVCGPLDGAFSCIEVDDPDAAVCSCGNIETGYIQDPYNPMKYYACLPGGEQVAQECKENEFYTGDHTDATTACSVIPKCDATNVGFNKYETSCTQYYFCDDDDGATTTVQTCDEGKVWDAANVGCVDPCTLAPASFTCDGKDPGAYPDTTDCGVFHLCFAGQQITQQCTDETDKYFNENGMCGSDPKDCPTVDACYEEYQDTCSITALPSPTTTTTTTQVTTAETTSTERTHKTTTTTPSSTTDATERSTTSTTPETTQTTTDETTTDETTTDETSTTEPSTTTELADVCDAETGICDCSKVTSAAYFPHNETCSKFYSCESDDNGGFEQKEYSCPGDLVFDPVNQYCNLLNLVPSCQNP